MIVKASPLSVLRAQSAAALETRGERAAFRLWNGLMLLLSSAGLCAMCLLLGIGMMDVALFLDYFRFPLLFLLNWLPILGFQLLALCLFNRQWAAYLLTAVLFLTASIGDFYKLRFRSEPFVFSDWNVIGAGLRVAGKYDMTPNARILLALALIPLGTALLFFLVRGRLPGRGRAAAGALVLLSVLPLWRWVYSSSTVYYSPAASSDHVVTGWAQQEQVSKGFVYQYLYSISAYSSGPPEDYDEDAALQLAESMPDAPIPPDRRVHVLVFQMEAFCDLRELGIEGISPEVYRDYDLLLQEGISGRLVANVFAGGTQNTERCFLTGSLALQDYSAPAPSAVWYLASQGYATVGSHPNAQDFYNRRNVNAYLGFQDYWFPENHYAESLAGLDNTWYSDCVVFPEATEQLLALAEAGQPVFSFNVTMQGHGPYSDSELVLGDGWWTGEGLTPQSACILNNYLGSVHDSLGWLRRTADRLRDEEEPVVLVIYGDHKPWLGDQNRVYNELGVSLDTSTEQGFYNYYSTPYLIWANNAARELLDSPMSGTGPTVSAGFLMTVLFDTLGWTGSTAIQSSRPVMEQIPVLSSNGLYVTDAGLTGSLTPEQEQLVSRLRWIQYYLNKSFSPPAQPGV